jgi:hypothetical protein
MPKTGKTMQVFFVIIFTFFSGLSGLSRNIRNISYACDVGMKLAVGLVGRAALRTTHHLKKFKKMIDERGAGGIVSSI